MCTLSHIPTSPYLSVCDRRCLIVGQRHFMYIFYFVYAIFPLLCYSLEEFKCLRDPIFGTGGYIWCVVIVPQQTGGMWIACFSVYHIFLLILSNYIFPRFIVSRSGLRPGHGNVVRRDLLLRPDRHHALLFLLVVPGRFALVGLQRELARCRQLLQQQRRDQPDGV